MASTLSGGSSKIRVTSSRMYSEHVMTRPASNVSHHSTWWISTFNGPGRCPWWRPYSVAWTVATSGSVWRSFSAAAA